MFNKMVDLGRKNRLKPARKSKLCENVAKRDKVKLKN